MKNNGLFQHKFLQLFTFMLAVAVMAIGFSACSTSKNYGQTEHKRTKYSHVKVKQPRWNTTTSTSTTYYIKKQKPRKRFNP